MPAPAPASALRVLLVEDQPDIAANLWDFLERRGYRLDHCADGASGLARARRGGFDVIVLDLGLPRLDGLELCRQLRAAGDAVPILMLTARDTLEDKLRGFAEGADDYMVKPFALRELDARIRALHRGFAPTPASRPDAALHYDAATMTATREGRSIPLSRTQGRLLALLLRQAPAIVGHAELLQAGWPEDGGDLPALHQQMYALRNLVDRPFDRALIASVRGVGYRVLA